VNPFIRWCKFNFVGAMGMGLQLAALALINRVVPGHYLYASAAAVELAVLHNFVWHIHYTWRDRRDGSSVLSSLLRFHLSNGLVSIAGNLALMRLLVHQAHLAVLVSNVIAILCCSVVNFYLGNTWAFASETKTRSSRPFKLNRTCSSSSFCTHRSGGISNQRKKADAPDDRHLLRSHASCNGQG
jgi:putative flippase GtrA